MNRSSIQSRIAAADFYLGFSASDLKRMKKVSSEAEGELLRSRLEDLRQLALAFQENETAFRAIVSAKAKEKARG